MFLADPFSLGHRPQLITARNHYAGAYFECIQTNVPWRYKQNMDARVSNMLVG